MRIPYHRQSKDWTCGPAALRMALAAFGVTMSEAKSSRMLATSRRTGTKTKRLVTAARRLFADARFRQDADLSDLSRALRQGSVVIVVYYIPEEKTDHFSIVRRVTSRRIFFLDPWFGPRHSYARRDFLRVWYEKPGSDLHKRCYLAVRGRR